MKAVEFSRSVPVLLVVLESFLFLQVDCRYSADIQGMQTNKIDPHAHSARISAPNLTEGNNCFVYKSGEIYCHAIAHPGLAILAAAVCTFVLVLFVGVFCWCRQLARSKQVADSACSIGAGGAYMQLQSQPLPGFVSRTGISGDVGIYRHYFQANQSGFHMKVQRSPIGARRST